MNRAMPSPILDHLRRPRRRPPERKRSNHLQKRLQGKRQKSRRRNPPQNRKPRKHGNQQPRLPERSLPERSPPGSPLARPGRKTGRASQSAEFDIRRAADDQELRRWRLLAEVPVIDIADGDRPPGQRTAEVTREFQG